MGKISKRGFTMIEVLAAFAMLTLAILMLTTMFGTIGRIIAEASQVQTQGNLLASSASDNLQTSSADVICTITTANVSLQVGGNAIINPTGTSILYTSSLRNSVHLVVFTP
ncbi:MAG: type II secretion system protein [Clostridia bacterium]